VAVDPPPICVVHLARAANGIGPLRSFLDSYRAHPAGIEHDLLIVLKGFRPPLPPDYEFVLSEVTHRRRFVADRGLDVDVYFGVAHAVEHDVLFFLNSFSVILADDWLAKMHAALSQDGVGLVGATGSWHSTYLPYSNAASEAAARALRPAWKRLLLRWFPFLGSVRRRIRLRRVRGKVDPFPNYHLRTNAFMFRRETALRIEFEPTRRKLDAYLFESGRRGLTCQVLAMSLRVLVVDRAGNTYEMPDWNVSNTFWRLNQENLMIADNQTRAYDVASVGGRLRYSTWAWGPHADHGSQT
jgi:hypothetical protein